MRRLATASLLSAGLLGARVGLAQPPPPPPPAFDQQVARAELAGAAAASPRPGECKPQKARAGAAWTHWDRASRPAEAAYCDALARGFAALARAPEIAAKAADQAEARLANRAAPQTLKARALLAQGRVDEAWKAFATARKRSKKTLEEPATLHDFAITALVTGNAADALTAYRALVPRASLLADARRRQRVYVEAALVVMGEGPDKLDEALGYLVEARRQRGTPTLSDLVLGSVALALDRLGRSDEARGVAAEAGGPFAAQRLAKSEPTAIWLRPLVTRPGELHAVAAMLAERRHPDVAKSEWRAYLESDAGKRGKWTEHAKKKLEGTPGGRPKPPPKKARVP